MELGILARYVELKGREHWRNTEPLQTVRNEATGGILDLLFRGNRFQIERIIHGPGQEIALHRHPEVDSYDFPLWGSGEIQLGKRKFFLDEKTTPWRGIFISRNTWHGGAAKEKGGAFLTVQEWHVPITGSIIESWQSK